ncbi:MAG: short-chain dehydrogenase [Rhodospirillaceae bacterium]|nr:short-chain dehydrogenase [Rhodospirillaceae bacterium]|tara:strand:+ start:720 stop:1517 length:798 start_codon:yes stop_codon:yes gene_type:complete
MRVIVTGVSPGIGGATCRKLTQMAKLSGGKARIAACEIIETESINKLADELRDEGAEVLTLTGDLSIKTTPGDMVTKTIETFGGIDAVVSNAGITSPAPLNELEVEQWDKLMAVNTRATLLLAQASYTALKESKGSLVAVASMSGMGAHPGMGAYSPSKAALISLCQVLAQEWAADGINVNTVSPGLIRTPLTKTVYENNQIAKDRAALVPLGRIGKAEDIANVISFLLSREADYMTGQNILVDGGFVDSLYGHIPGLPQSNLPL